MELSNTTCAIWLVQYVESDIITVFPEWFHTYHKACLGDWFKKKYSCPMDRNRPTKPNVDKTKQMSDEELFKNLKMKS